MIGPNVVTDIELIQENFDKHGSDQQRYQEKGGQGGKKNQSVQTDYRQRNDRKPNPGQRKPKINSYKPKVIVIEIEDKDLEKRVISNFAGFVYMLSSET